MHNAPRQHPEPATLDPGVLGDFARWLHALAGDAARTPAEAPIDTLRDVGRFYNEAARWVRDVEDEMRSLCSASDRSACDAIAAENTAAALSRIGGRVAELLELAKRASSAIAQRPAPPEPAAEEPATEPRRFAPTATTNDDLRGRVDAWRHKLREERDAARESEAAKRRAYVDSLRRDVKATVHDAASSIAAAPVKPSTPAPAPAPRHGPQGPSVNPPRFRRIDR